MNNLTNENEEQMQLDIFSEIVDDTNKEKIKASYVITKDEVLSDNESANSSKNALAALKERVKIAAEEATLAIKESMPEPIEVKEEQPESKKVEVLITEEIKVIEQERDGDAIIEQEEVKDEEKPKLSLYDKCKPFLINEDGTEEQLLSKPLYQLQSVAEILSRDSKDALDRLSEQYEFNFETKFSSNAPLQKTEKKVAEPVKSEIKESAIEIPANKVKNPQSNVAFVISDIDIPENIDPQPEVKSEAATATITFTPVSDKESKEKRISVSQNTRSIDLTGEIMKAPEEISETQEIVKLESNEFDEFVPNEEIVCEKTGAKIVRKLAIIKRNRFIALSGSVLFFILLLFFKFPFMDGFFIENPTAAMSVCTIFTVLITILNGDMFLSLKNIFSRNGSPDILLSFATLVTLVYSGFTIKSGDRFYDIIFLLAVILLFRATTKFFKVSSQLLGAKLVAANGTKTAVRLIDEPAVTFAMAKSTIEGDVLIAAPQKTEIVGDFMKYSTYDKFLGGKFPIILILSLIFSILFGIASYFYFGTVNDGLYAACSVLLICTSPIIFLIDNLPFYRASKKLYTRQSCIAGKMGAQSIEMANAVVLNAVDIFPSGTVTLHQMKVLSEIDMEDTIIRAAALTESMNSPLAPIFKKIAGTTSVERYPDSDTLKYEDKMGISGWVDNRLLFIGNRTLMEAHGISVPSVEVDKKILRQGYFPVYVATRETACALLMVQYSVDKYVQKELQRLSNAGVTLLVDSCDPNLTNNMICDYLELFDDSVYVMATVGSHVFKNTVVKTEAVSAPAAFKGSGIHLISIFNSVSRIKISNIVLTVMYVLSAVLGLTMFVYSSFSVSGQLWSAETLLIYSLLSAIISYIVYLIKRP